MPSKITSAVDEDRVVAMVAAEKTVSPAACLSDTVEEAGWTRLMMWENEIDKGDANKRFFAQEALVVWEREW